MTNGTPGFAIPAFSVAIFSSVSPRYFMWSRSILVTALTIGSRTLVLSSRPPSPTSTTTISAPRAAKSAKAIAVVASKKVACRSRMIRSRCPVHMATAASEIGDPVHLNAFPEGNQMGGGVEADPEAHLAQDLGHKRADASLPVGPADVHREENPVRMTQRVQQRARVVQPELDRRGAREKKFQRLGVARGRGPAGFRRSRR